MKLDLSGNKLRSLPAELGEMVHLRELLLNNNFIRVLPYEIGKLFQLIMLGELLEFICFACLIEIVPTILLISVQ